MLSGPQKKFCEGVASGLNDGDAYAAAFPKSKHPGRDAGRLRSDKNPKKSEIDAEIERLRNEAAKMIGGAILTLAEKRSYLRSVVMTAVGEVDEKSTLCQSFERSRRLEGYGEEKEEWETEKIKMPCKLKAIELDAKLAGEFKPDKIEFAGKIVVVIGE